MTARSPLRAVAPNETAAEPRSKPKTLTQAAASGTQRELLVALRARIAEALRARIAEAVADPHCPQRDLAALSRRLFEIAREIEAIDLSGSEGGVENGVVPDEPFDYSSV